MGHHARTLTAVVAVLSATTLVAASTAAAQPAIVRAETRDMNAIATGAFINRTAVSTAAVTVQDLAGAQPDQTCADTSPVAALAAAVGATQVKTQYDATTHHWLLSTLKGLGPQGGLAPPTQPKWSWRIYVDQAPIDGGGGWEAGDVCAATVPTGSEVLAYQSCGSQTFGCYSGTPLYTRIRDGGPYDIAPQTVPGRGAPVAIKIFGDPPIGTPAAALFGTDEPGFTPTQSLATGPLQGQAQVSFTEPGPHQIIGVASNGTRPPARLAVCVSEGNDGYCGSTRYQPPPEVPYVTPSPCATNGHDGFCGTTDTSGPVTHVTNIPNKRVFKANKGPGQVKGTIDLDPNGVGAVQLRLTRVTTAKVLVKPKKSKAKKKAKKRYKTVKRCTAWSDDKALLVTAQCGTKNAKWFKAELSDLRNEFTYGFALTLPKGTYTLEVSATDEDGHKDAPAHGRNVITFAVK
ncbi:hypothetical protein DSM104299_04284 [Baekduia alba]|uniref:hypothetical protein n=1 Tax=Baekduia alba TaxID=2997333 RepID=UPI002341D7B6|nr:hypothetical protein [Baekduia alba]WCB95535.1 hypothetical protein DSM104299_04284 [Baekduia alba]